MALQNNVFYTNLQNNRFFGGNSDFLTIQQRVFNFLPLGEASISQESAIPNGYRDTWTLAIRTNALSSFSPDRAQGSGSLILLSGRNLEASGSFSISGTATGDLIFQENLNGSGTFSLSGSATLGQVTNVSASGSLELTGSATIQGIADGVATGSAALTGSGTLGGLIDLTGSAAASLTGTAIRTALANLEGTNVTGDPLSPESLANAVWSKDVTGFLTTGSAGKKLNDAGGGSSPTDIAAAVWDTVASSANDSGSMGEQVQKARKAAENAFAVSS